MRIGNCAPVDGLLHGQPISQCMQSRAQRKKRFLRLIVPLQLTH